MTNLKKLTWNEYIYMNIFLETKRLMIKIPDLSDFDDLYLLQCNPDVMKYIGEGVRTKQEVELSLQKAIAHYL